MSYYDNIEHVKAYIKMCEGYSPIELIATLKKHLTQNSTLLEIGMGPGNDLDVLKEDYTVTGSDVTEHFLTLYKEQNPDADLLLLDAITLDTNRKFNALYSNKVLIHLTQENLKKSIKHQRRLLNADGLIFHTFWKGTGSELTSDTLTQYYQENELVEMFQNEFELLSVNSYKELADDDSILLIMKAK